MESQLQTMNVCTKLHGNPSNICQDMDHQSQEFLSSEAHECLYKICGYTKRPTDIVILEPHNGLCNDCRFAITQLKKKIQLLDFLYNLILSE